MSTVNGKHKEKRHYKKETEIKDRDFQEWRIDQNIAKLWKNGKSRKMYVNYTGSISDYRCIKCIYC